MSLLFFDLDNWILFCNLHIQLNPNDWSNEHRLKLFTNTQK